MFFTQTLSALVMNAKLERPLDSHAPQTEHVYAYVADDWGEAHEDEYGNQWEHAENHWESSENNEQSYEVEETYAMEGVNEDHEINDDQAQAESEEFDEDDQDGYM